MKRQLSLTERVHPYGGEEAPLHYPSVDQSHDIQMPADAMHKEKKKGLIEDPIVINNQGFNEEAQGAMTEWRKQRRRRRRRCVVRCCCCFGACVGTFLLLVGILVLIFFLVLHPKLPKYTITEAILSQFSISNTSSNSSSAAIASAIIAGEETQTVYLNVDLDLMVRMRNPNKKIGIDYRSINAELFYEGVEIGEGSIPGFYQGHKNTTYVGLTMQGRDIPLTSSLSTTLRNTLTNDDSIVLHARSITKVRIKIGHWKTRTSKVRVKCSVQLSNPTRGTVRLLHNHCKFKLLRLRL